MSLSQHLPEARVTVFYDGLCPLCSREIQWYQRKGTAGLIDYIDIAAPGFDARAHGLDPERVHAVFHVKALDGEILEGVPAFQKIWQTLPEFAWLYRLSKLPGARPMLEAGYFIFAKIRPYLPRRAGSCETDACEPRKTRSGRRSS